MNAEELNKYFNKNTLPLCPDIEDKPAKELLQRLTVGWEGWIFECLPVFGLKGCIWFLGFQTQQQKRRRLIRTMAHSKHCIAETSTIGFGKTQKETAVNAEGSCASCFWWKRSYHRC